ncbi:efflux RND transporter periplasmic adaptor subunit [Rubinisphaera margarita]|uniref:efflux RND transporter periplasmic adaptor subunit n=1 Tax=Rubinisphaera margarita TaxID=2909586 RepID=UPI001EE952EE|nr:efflux RND transporter periplasmic adaptor subunit [Rubinisphaera margarita]MCG6156256.1 efflux RND transporter periplasmic adaptor subunit [Rubinisphaera margarita]
MRPRIAQFLTLSLLCVPPVLLTSGCSQVQSQTTKKIEQKLIAVQPVTLVQEEIQRTSTQPATVHPFYEAEIRARTTGYVKEVTADIGDFVESGSTLIIIDVPELEKQREVLEAGIVRRRSEEKRAEAGIELARANIQAAEAGAQQARSEMSSVEASLAAAESEFSRTQDLVQRQSLESRVLDEVRQRRDAELARLDAVNSAIQSAQAEVTVANAKLASAQADLEAAKAETSVAERELEQLEVLVGYATIKAPFSGIVTRRSVDPGDLVREASEVGKGEPFFVISQIDKVRVQIPVPEIDAALVSRGDSVELSLPSFPAETPITAEVTRLTGSLDPSTRTMLVEAELDNSEGKLLPGMFGQATISLNKKVAANMLPARAVRFSDTGDAFVYAISADDTVSVVAVTTGLDNGSAIEVRSGLEPGQRVIDAHLKRFTDGQKVTVLSN